MKVIVYQSYRRENVAPWIHTCMGSVQAWADMIGAQYRFYDDEIFDRVPGWYQEKTKDRLVVQTDLGRLMLAKELLEEGYDQVIWCDADMLIFDPASLSIADVDDYAFGREVWVQHDAKNRLKAYRKIHNAFFVFNRDNSFLDFYIQSCLSIIKRIHTMMVPQIVGPKFLSAIHNIVSCPVVETAGMFSPLVVKDIIKGSGQALELLQTETQGKIAAGNLSASMQGRDTDGVCLCVDDLSHACDALLKRGLRNG